MTIKNINGTFFHVINSQGRVIGFATTLTLAYAKALEGERHAHT